MWEHGLFYQQDAETTAEPAMVFQAGAHGVYVSARRDGLAHPGLGCAGHAGLEHCHDVYRWRSGHC